MDHALWVNARNMDGCEGVQLHPTANRHKIKYRAERKRAVVEKKREMS